MPKTDLTVAAVVQKDGQFLMIEEWSRGNLVLTQPGGHIEAGESPEQAVVRETREETGCDSVCGDLIGAYHWQRPGTDKRYLRLVYAADLLSIDETATLDTGIERRLWLSVGDIVTERARHRSPAVLRCLEDYLKGKRGDLPPLPEKLSGDTGVHRVLRHADLV